MRSGFVAGDAQLLKAFLLYRTYHGSAMSPIVQAASIAAWSDEAHVVENRAQYRAQVRRGHAAAGAGAGRAPARCQLLPLGRRAGRRRPAFARDLLAQYNVTVLPGSYPRPRERRPQPRRRPRAHGPGGRNRRMPGSRAAHRPVRPEQPHPEPLMTHSSSRPSTPRGKTAPASPPAVAPRRKCAEAVEHVIAELNNGQPARGHARGRGPVDRAPVDQEGGAAVLPPEATTRS